MEPKRDWQQLEEIGLATAAYKQAALVEAIVEYRSHRRRSDGDAYYALVVARMRNEAIKLLMRFSLHDQQWAVEMNEMKLQYCMIRNHPSMAQVAWHRS